MSSHFEYQAGKLPEIFGNKYIMVFGGGGLWRCKASYVIIIISEEQTVSISRAISSSETSV
jgi:hypothetical protein